MSYKFIVISHRQVLPNRVTKRLQFLLLKIIPNKVQLPTCFKSQGNEFAIECCNGDEKFCSRVRTHPVVFKFWKAVQKVPEKLWYLHYLCCRWMSHYHHNQPQCPRNHRFSCGLSFHMYFCHPVIQYNE